MYYQGDVILFDAYGTLFDVSSVNTACADVTPDPDAFVAGWRRRQLEYSWLRTLFGRYRDFAAISADALDATAAALGVSLDPPSRERLLTAWLRPAAYPEVPNALRALGKRRLGILSNGSPAMLQIVLEHTGLTDRFTWVLSIDPVQAYKPAPAAYSLGPTATNRRPDEILFVSSNFWDVTGAATYGYRTCWVRRSAVAAEQLGVEPDWSIVTLGDLPPLLAPFAMS
jgi:2-haloacid dehalogenase